MTTKKKTTKKKTTKKKTTKKPTRRKKAARKSKAASDFLDSRSLVHAQSWVMTDEIGAIIDEANRRRLAGEASSPTLLARVLKDAFDIPLSADSLVKRIKAHVRRSTW